MFHRPLIMSCLFLFETVFTPSHRYFSYLSNQRPPYHKADDLTTRPPRWCNCVMIFSGTCINENQETLFFQTMNHSFIFQTLETFHNLSSHCHDFCLETFPVPQAVMRLTPKVLLIEKKKC